MAPASPAGGAPAPVVAPAPAPDAAAKLTAQERGGRSRGSTNYTLRETMYMLKTLRKFLPIEPEQRMKVVHTHEEN